MAFELKAVLQLQDKMSSKLHRATGYVDMMSKATQRLNRMLERASRANEALGQAAELTGGRLGVMTTAIAGVTAAAGAMGRSLKGAMDIEQNTAAIEHFLALDKRIKDVRGTATEYVKFLQKNAALTPFGSDEVLAAGRRAIQITQGNIDLAKKYLQIGEDMASLTPGKTLSDAMEAIADAMTGETERLKEFGFKITAEDAKKAGGYAAVMTNKVAKFFEGGTQRMAKMSSGLLQSALGTISSGLSNAGIAALDKLKPKLEALNTWLQSANFQSAMDSFSSAMVRAVEVGERLFNTGKKVYDFVSRYWPTIGPIVGTVTSAVVGYTLATRAAAVAQALLMATNPFGAIAAVIGSAIYAGYQLYKNWDTVKEKANELWATLKNAFATGVNWIVGKLNVLIDALNSVFSFKLPDWLGGGSFSLNIPKIPEMKIEQPKVKQAIMGPKIPEQTKPFNVVDFALKAPKIDGSHYHGIDYVPRDRYVAELHRGERVLTAQENREYSRGGAPTVNITVNGLTVREEADVERIARRLAREIKAAAWGMA